jgi:hypothetical protein
MAKLVKLAKQAKLVETPATSAKSTKSRYTSIKAHAQYSELLNKDEIPRRVQTCGEQQAEPFYFLNNKDKIAKRVRT